MHGLTTNFAPTAAGRTGRKGPPTKKKRRAARADHTAPPKPVAPARTQDDG